MNNKKIILGLVFTLACSLAVGDMYNYEISVDYLQADAELTQIDTTNIDATYYLSPVKMDDVPLSEAAFLSRATSLSVGYERRSVEQMFAFVQLSTPLPPLIISQPPDFGIPADGSVISNPSFLPRPIEDSASFISSFPFAGNPVGDDQDWFSIGGEYITDNGWLAGLEYSRAADDSSSTVNDRTSSFDTKIETVRLSVGRYIGPMTTVLFEYLDTSNQFDSVFEGFATIGFFPIVDPIPVETRSNSDSSTNGYSLKAKTLLRRWGYLHKIQTEVGYDVIDSTATFSNSFDDSPQVMMSASQSYAKRWAVGYALYPRNDIEIGLGFTSVDPEFGKQDTLNVLVEWFVKPRVALRADYVSTNTDQSFADSDGFGIGVTGRF